MRFDFPKNGLAIALAMGWCANAAASADERLLSLLPKIQLPEPAEPAFYEERIFPVLDQYCYECHSDGIERAGFAFDVHADYAEMITDREFWRDVQLQMSTHVMPPPRRAQPDMDDRQAVVDWIENTVFYVDPRKPDPGRVTLHRVNRTEYNNIVRDVFGINFQPADDFPADDTGYGFDNIADVLSLPPLLMEKYLAAAQQVTDQVMVAGRPGPPVRQIGLRSLRPTGGGVRHEQRGITFMSNSTVREGVWMAHDGRYRLVIEAGGSPAEGVRAKMRVEFGDVLDVEEETRTDFGRSADHVYEFDIERGTHELRISFTNDLYLPDKGEDRNLSVNGVRFEGPLQPDPERVTVAGSGFDLPQGGAGWSRAGDDGEGPVWVNAGVEVARKVVVETPGRYRLRVRSAAEWGGTERAPVMEVTIGDKVATGVELRARREDQSGESHWFEFHTSGGEQLVTIALRAPEGAEGARLWLRDLMVEGPVEVPAEWLPAFHARLLDGREVSVEAGQRMELARDLVARVGRLLFRRTLDEDEVRRYVSLVPLAEGHGDSFEAGLALSLQALMTSPNFVFRGGGQPVGEPFVTGSLVDEVTLASRLSFFLWSSVPDETLLDLAERGELRDQLREQVRRMLADERASALTEHFAGQWLQLRDMRIVSPDPERFPDFDGRLRQDMVTETRQFFDYMLKENRSVLDLLGADYTFVNENLAKHYGIDGVQGGEFRKVSLEGTPRRGVLTHGSILTVTSDPTRTSPVKRGKWVLENILGLPPPPAPQDIPEFDEDGAEGVEGTLRLRLEAHRDNPACASCHAYMDPIGFAYEHFDAIGRWRENDSGDEIEAAGHLITGEAFAGHLELQAMFVRDFRHAFLKNVTETMLTYALGRGVDVPDKPVVLDIVRRVEQEEHGMQELVLAIVESVPFQFVRLEDPAQVAGAAGR